MSKMFSCQRHDATKLMRRPVTLWDKLTSVLNPEDVSKEVLRFRYYWNYSSDFRKLWVERNVLPLIEYLKYAQQKAEWRTKRDLARAIWKVTEIEMCRSGMYSPDQITKACKREYAKTIDGLVEPIEPTPVRGGELVSRRCIGDLFKDTLLPPTTQSLMYLADTFIQNKAVPALSLLQAPNRPGGWDIHELKTESYKLEDEFEAYYSNSEYA